MTIIIAIKIIADMLWQYQSLDIFLTLSVLVVFMAQYKKLVDFKVGILDAVVCLFLIHGLVSFIQNPDAGSMEIYVKFASSLIIYISARLTDLDFSEFLIIKYSTYVVIGVILAMYLMKQGFIYWGNAFTFRGPYYFKTDLALALTQCGVILVFFKGKNRIINGIDLGLFYILIPFLIIQSNSRAYYIIYILILILHLFSLYSPKMNLSRMIQLAILPIFLVIAMSYASQTDFFISKGFIGVEFDSFADLLNESNSQGRSVIWSNIYSYFENEGFHRRLFGIDLISDVSASMRGVDSHNTYLKVLFSFGMFGLTYYLIMQVYLFFLVQNFDGREHYFCLAIWMIYQLSSLSYSNISYTQQSWLFYLVMGIVVNKAIASKTIQRSSFCLLGD